MHLEDKNNLAPRGRSRGPILDANSLGQVERATTPLIHGHSRSRSGVEELPDPPRPPPPRSQGFYGCSNTGYHSYFI